MVGTTRLVDHTDGLRQLIARSSNWNAEMTKRLAKENRPTIENFQQKIDHELKSRQADLAELVCSSPIWPDRWGFGPD